MVVTTTPQKRRFNIIFPEPLLEELQRVSDEEGTSVVETMRRFIRFGVGVRREMGKHPDAEFVIKWNGGETKILSV